MEGNVFKKALVVGIIFLFIGVAFIPNFNAVSIEEKTISTSTDPDPEYSFIFGRIKDLYDDDYEIRFNAVNLRIISFMPEFGIYHLTSGEKITIICFAPGGIFFYGIKTQNFVFAIAEIDSIGW
jgi:hypothetical protein